MVTKVDCPSCGTPVPWSDASPWRPFCSERCRVIDLGDWAAERHVIPGKLPLGDGDANDEDSTQRGAAGRTPEED